jgi:transposase-like protein
MDPTEAFCPNPECPARGQTGQGNIVIHSRKEQRFKCRQCGKTFAQRKGSAFYRLRTPVETVTLVVTLLAHGCPVQAIVAAFGLDERTVASWLGRAGRQCQAVHEHLVEQPRDLRQVQADELRVKVQGGICWMAMALCVRFRLWLGGEVSPHRDLPLIRRLVERVRRCAVINRVLLFCTDGLSSYPSAIKKVFRDPERNGRHGRPRLVFWPHVLIAQVVKRYKERRVESVEHRPIVGNKRQIQRAVKRSQGQGVINTAFIERINGTFRERLGSLVRRSRALARKVVTLKHGMFLIGTIYNFCTPHGSLSLPAPGGKNAMPCTPATAAGITDRTWSVDKVLSYHVPPPRWVPPKARGRHSRKIQEWIDRWLK